MIYPKIKEHCKKLFDTLDSIIANIKHLNKIKEKCCNKKMHFESKSIEVRTPDNFKLHIDRKEWGKFIDSKILESENRAKELDKKLKEELKTIVFLEDDNERFS